MDTDLLQLSTAPKPDATLYRAGQGLQFTDTRQRFTVLATQAGNVWIEDVLVKES